MAADGLQASTMAPEEDKISEKISDKQDERERIQKKTFTKWVNSHLHKVGQQIEDLYRDLRDGHSLISLLEVLSGEKLKRERGKLRIHRLQNVSFALDFLQKRQVKLVNIRSEEIVDGNSKLILGLIWTIILHFQVSDIQVEGQNKKVTAQNGLLLWARQMTDGYHELHCENFTTSWRDGKLFNAIIHKHRPDLVDMKKVYVQHARENLERAFSTAEINFHVPQLLDPEDVDVETPDEKSIVTYVSTLYDAFPKCQHGSGSITINDVDEKSTEYLRHARALLGWLKDHTAKLTERGLPKDPMEMKAMWAWLLQLKEQEVPKREKEKEALLTLHQALQVWVEFGRVRIPGELSVKEVNKAWKVFLEALMSKELSVQDHDKRMSQEVEKAAQKKLSDMNEIFTKIRQMQVDLDSRRWPNSLSELNIDLDKHIQFGMVLETLCGLVKKARMQTDVPAWLEEEYGKSLTEVDRELKSLMDNSASRKSHLESLVEFLRPLEEQSRWITKAAEREEAFDWSDKNSEMESKQRSHLEFQAELARREPSIKRLEKAGEVLITQGHPTSSFIKTALHDLKNRWHWVLQLRDCAETHLQENTKYFQFFKDLIEAEKNLESMQQNVKTRLSWNADSGLEGINKILANPLDQKQAELLRSRVQDLLQRAVTVVQLKPRGSGQHETSSVPLRAACECSHGKVTVSKGEECRLDGRAEGKEWTVLCRDGKSVKLPSVCFTMGPPNLEAKERSARLEQQLEKVKQQLIRGSEELRATRDLLIHIQKIWSWAGDKTVEAEQLITAQKELELQRRHFRERSQEGLAIDATVRAQVEAKAEACWARLQQMQRESAESEAACRRYISMLRNTRLQLEACEGRAAAPDGVHKYDQHMASLKEEVEELSTTLEGVSQEASSLLQVSPSVPSAPSLRSELQISVETLQRLRLLCSKLPELSEVNGNILSVVEDSLRTTKLVGLGGRSMWDLLWDVEMSEEERQQLARDFHLGKLSAEELRATLEAKQNERRKMDLKLPGLRQEVSVKDLEESLILDKATADGLAQGKKMTAEVSKSLSCFLGGSRSIAGLYIEKTKQKVSLYKAMKLGLLRPATTLELLEAQAATGYMIDPVGNTQLSVEEAVRKGLIGAEFKDKILAAEHAITGYKDPQTGNKISLFQAMQKGLILRSHGIRLLEAQIATGGIIDPKASHRLPIKVAYSRGLFDEEINRHLTDPHSETKGFLDPNTEENLTYVQLIEQCITDHDTGLCLLVLKEKQPWSKISQDIVIAQIEQIENTENTFLENKPNVSETIVSKSETRYIVIETQLAEELKKLKLEIPCGKNTGKELTLQEIFDGNLIDEETKKKLMADYRSGKLTKAMLLSRISELLIEKESSSKYLKFSGIRRDLTMDELVSSGVIDEATACDLSRGSKTVEEVSDSIRGYLSGTGCLAGLFIERNQETVPIYAAMQRGLIRPGTALELLEAQAATGHIIDPVKHARLTVEEAAKAGLIGDEFRTKLLSAEGAVMGYNDPYTGKRISLFQALKRNLIVKHHGVRLLEAQIATGGIIDPQASHRLPVETAYSRGLFDKEMNRILSDATEDTKGFFDPNTQENLTYKKLLSRCFADAKTNMLLLPLKEKRGIELKTAAFSSLQQRKIFVVDEDLGKKMNIQQAYREKYINQEQYQHLSGRECEWEEIIYQSPEKKSTLLVDRKSGLQFNIDDALADGLIDQGIIDKYRTHQLSVFDLGSQLLAASKVRASSKAYMAGNVAAQGAALPQKWTEAEPFSMSLEHNGAPGEEAMAMRWCLLLFFQCLLPLQQLSLVLLQHMPLLLLDVLFPLDNFPSLLQHLFFQFNGLGEGPPCEMTSDGQQSAVDGKIGLNQDQRERVQKKTLTRWVNTHLKKVQKKISDLYVDLRDGNNLISLLEVLSREKLTCQRGLTCVHRRQNVQNVLDYLQKKQVKLVNIRSEDIVEGNPKVTLGLIWTIIQHFQIPEVKVDPSSQALPVLDKLLEWVKNTTRGYRNLQCLDFSSSWRNGKLFNSLIHKHRPALVQIEEVAKRSNQQNLEMAFEVAAKNLGVPKLLDAEDVNVEQPDEKSIVTYLSFLYSALNQEVIENGSANHTVDITETLKTTKLMISQKLQPLPIWDVLHSEQLPAQESQRLMAAFSTGQLTLQQLGETIIQKIKENDEEIERTFEKTTVKIQRGMFAGKILSLHEIFSSNLLQKQVQLDLFNAYKVGKMSLMILKNSVLQALEATKKTDSSKTFQGLRKEVTVDELLSSKVIDEATATAISRGTMKPAEVKHKIEKVLHGTSPIAGLYHEEKREKMSIYAALRKGYLRPGTGLLLLEAQAATAFIIDPVNNLKLSVEDAVKQKVIGLEYKDKLMLAERAATGYKDPATGEILSVFKFIEKGLILKHHGLRLLAVQIATGGIIDSQASHRLPLDVAYSRGLFNEEMNRILLHPSDDTKGYVDPNTQENLTYSELLSRCIVDPDTGFLLVPFKCTTKGSTTQQVACKSQREEARVENSKFLKNEATTNSNPSSSIPNSRYSQYSSSSVKTESQIKQDFQEIILQMPEASFDGKKMSINELFTKDIIPHQMRKNLTEDYKCGRIDIEAVITKVIEIINGIAYHSIQEQRSNVQQAPQTEQELLQTLQKIRLKMPVSGFAGREMTLKEVFESKIIDMPTKNTLMTEFRSGKMSADLLISQVTQIIDTRANEIALRESPAFAGLRHQVSINDLLAARIIDDQTTRHLVEGKTTMYELKPLIKTYTDGNSSIAGILAEGTNEKMTIDMAMRKGLIKPTTGLMLLEAQAATGSIIDPVRNRMFSLDDAVQNGIVAREHKTKLVLAEQALTGYKDPYSGKTISLFQAMQKRLIMKDLGTRLLEAQIATGGIVDPKVSLRLPLEVAYLRGLFDERMAKMFSNLSNEAKGFFDPNTDENITYLELMKRCIRDPNTGLLLFQISKLAKQKVEAVAACERPSTPMWTRKGRTDQEFWQSLDTIKIKLPVAKYGGKEMFVKEVFNTGIIEAEAKRKLAEDYKQGSINIEMVINKIVEIIDKKAQQPATNETQELAQKLRNTMLKLPDTGFHGKVLSMSEVFDSGIIEAKDKKTLLDNLKSGKISFDILLNRVTELIDAKANKIPQHLASRTVKTDKEISEALEKIRIRLPIPRFGGKELSVKELFDKGIINYEARKNLLEDYRQGKISIDDVIDKTVDIINTLAARATEWTSPATHGKDSQGVPGPEEQPLFKTAQEVTQELKNVRLKMPEAVLGGKEMTLKEVIDSAILDPEIKKMLIVDFTLGKISLNIVVGRVTEILDAKACEVAQRSLPTFPGLRRRVSVTDLVDSHIIDQQVAKQLLEGTKTVEEVSPLIKTYLVGSSSIAGLTVETNKEKVSIYSAMKRGLIKPGLGLMLLEAQAGTGYMIDPVRNQKYSVEDAVRVRLVGCQHKDKLLVAEQALTGYRDPYTGKTISLFEAMNKGLVAKSKAIYLLEAQIATGGIIDPRASHRLPIDVAYSRGLLNNNLNRILSNPTDATKGFFDPNTEDNLTYSELMKRCVTDPITGLLLLPLKPNFKQQTEAFTLLERPSTPIIMEKTIKTDQDIFHSLEKIKIRPEGQYVGREQSLNEVLNSDIIISETKRDLVEDYRHGKITIETFVNKIIEILRKVNMAAHDTAQIPAQGIPPVKRPSESYTSSDKPLPKSEQGLLQTMQKIRLKMPDSRFGESEMSLKEVMESNIIDQEISNMLMADLRMRKITVDMLISRVTDIIDGLVFKGVQQPVPTFPGLRQNVSTTDLLSSRIIDQQTANQVIVGVKTAEEVKSLLKSYLDGSRSIAGLLVEGTKERISIYNAIKKGLIRPGSGLVMLEAQAATGYMIDPVKNQMFTVEEAVRAGLVGWEHKEKLLAAERALTGYKDPYTGKTISAFQAMKKGLIMKNHAVRLLDAQIGTGGIVDPHASHRLPLEVAYIRGLFDKEMHMLLANPGDDNKGFFDPNTKENLSYCELLQRCIVDDQTGLYLLPFGRDAKEQRSSFSQKESTMIDREPEIPYIKAPEMEDFMKTDEDVSEALKNTTVRLPEVKFGGKRVTLETVFNSDFIDEAVKNKIILDYKRGEITIDIAKTQIAEIIYGKAIEASKQPVPTFQGLRHQVRLEDLVEARILDEPTANNVREGKKSIDDVLPLVKSYLDGTVSIAGVYVEATKESMSFYNAMKEGLIRPGIGMELLEAQAATGYLMDPVKNEKFSVEEAVKAGLIGLEHKEKLISAENAVKGFQDPYSAKTISLFEAIKEEMVVRDRGIRLLEAQLATGGIIDPLGSYRLPVTVAYTRELFDENVNRLLSDPSENVKSYTDPNTGEDVTYQELMQRCLKDYGTGMLLLPLAEQKVAKGVPLITHDIIITMKEIENVDVKSDGGEDMTVAVESLREDRVIIIESDKEDLPKSDKMKRLDEVGIEIKFGDEAGKKLSMSEILHSTLIEETRSQELLHDYESGKVTTRELMEKIAGIIEDHEVEKAKKALKFKGLRNEVTAGELLDSLVLDETTLREVVRGVKSVEEVSSSIKDYMEGTGCIAGFIDEKTKERMSISSAIWKGLVKYKTGMLLLEAQAATGFIIDPVNNLRLTVDEAITNGVIVSEYHDKLLSAERAVTCYKDYYTGGKISLFEGMCKGFVVHERGIRLLEAQLATGGIIDHKTSHRLPMEVAIKRGLFDEKMKDILSNPSDATKGFVDPNTDENVSYLELMEQCVIDSQTGCRLLVLKWEPGERECNTLQRRKIVLDPDSQTELTVEEAFKKGILDEQLYSRLAAEECEWEEIKVQLGDGDTSLMLVDKRSGRKFDVNRAIEDGLVDEETVRQYQAGAVSIFDLGKLLLASPTLTAASSTPKVAK
uniref:epiplakin-like n=1 Tax=Myxine glutinosa TaxID=7769 RepID=UPI00358F1399